MRCLHRPYDRIQPYNSVNGIILMPILQVRKLRFGAMVLFAQGYTTTKRQSQVQVQTAPCQSPGPPLTCQPGVRQRGLAGMWREVPAWAWARAGAPTGNLVPSGTEMIR